MEEILTKIKARRATIQQFISRQGPRNKTLINLAIICGMLGTVLAGIPAAGGQSAIDSLKAMTQPSVPVWQILCMAAALSTATATVATALRTNHDTATKLSKAQTCEAKLEMLELMISANQIELKQAIEKYSEYSSDVAFIPNT